ncbi:hypothetical protein HID58_065657 [Brassica napus]|uniref:UBC core domain-containing protein n=1 Tax=Brassica napus TaxID=3708 RepID=A0ABQ7ZDS2_BRANA|nr:hypothetical protein HID58_065657 [Brassica napus]
MEIDEGSTSRGCRKTHLLELAVLLKTTTSCSVMLPDDSPWDGVKPLLCDPNPSSPPNSEAARMFSESKREYNR